MQTNSCILIGPPAGADGRAGARARGAAGDCPITAEHAAGGPGVASLGSRQPPRHHQRTVATDRQVSAGATSSAISSDEPL